MGAGFRSSNRQTPSCRETPNPKLQNTLRQPGLRSGGWCFSGVWSFELEVSFRLPFVHGNDYGANERGGQEQADDLQRQNVFGHQLIADLADGGGWSWRDLMS